MKLPFLKKKAGADLSLNDEYRAGENSFERNKDNEKGRKGPVRIAFYGGVFIVFVVAVGGYYYLNSTRMSLNTRIANNAPVLVKAIDFGGSQGEQVSRETRFVQEPSDQTEQSQKQPASNAMNQPLSPIPAGVEPKKEAESVETAPSKTHSMPVKEITKKNIKEASSSIMPDGSETLLNQLVLREDNPFRNKFMKKYQDSHALGKPQKKDGRLINHGRSNRSSMGGKRERVAPGFTEGEFDLLPAIVGETHDMPRSFKVFGVIRAQDASIALTSRGELKVGSIVDGDVIARIDINEICFKSGKTFKVSAQ